MSVQRVLRRLVRDGSGVAVVYVAVLAPVLFGAVGLSLDVGLWYAAKRQAQTAADSAAVAGAHEFVRAAGNGAVVQAARAEAARNGFGDASGAAIMVNVPPASGFFTGQANAVEAIVRAPVPHLFSQFLFNAPVAVTARGVATARLSDICVWSLAPSGNGIHLQGAARVDLDNCGIYVGSSSPDALSGRGAPCLRAEAVEVVGGYTGPRCLDPTPATGVPPRPDPLAGLAAPSVGGCDFTGLTVGPGPHTLSPGVYCDGLKIRANAAIALQPGIYVIAGGTFSVAGNVTVRGSGVMFYLTQRQGQHADIDFKTGTYNLSAPTTGDYKGVLFFQDRSAPNTLVNAFVGNPSLNFDGALYFPTTRLKLQGAAGLDLEFPFMAAYAIELIGAAKLTAVGPTAAPYLLERVTLVE